MYYVFINFPSYMSTCIFLIPRPPPLSTTCTYFFISFLHLLVDGSAKLSVACIADTRFDHSGGSQSLVNSCYVDFDVGVELKQPIYSGPCSDGSDYDYLLGAPSLQNSYYCVDGIRRRNARVAYIRNVACLSLWKLLVV